MNKRSRQSSAGRLGVLIDERRPPSVRTVIGRLLSRAERAEFAVGRIRLAAVNLARGELASVRHIRVLVARLDAGALVEGGPDGGPARERGTGVAQPVDEHAKNANPATTMAAFLSSGRVEIRASAGASWTPDFSVLRGLNQGHSVGTRQNGRGEARGMGGAPAPAVPDGVCIVGAHFFARPIPVSGPAFTTILTDAAAVSLALERFESLWEEAYDVLPVVASMIVPAPP